MTANNPFSDPNFGAEASGTNNPFSNPEFGKPSGFTRRVADQGIKLAQGVVGVPEAAVGVADLVTGGQAGKLAEQAGVRFKDAKDILGEYLSPEQKAADAEVQKADGFLPTLGAMVRNPSTIIGSAVESAPSMLVGGAASRGLLAVAPKIGAIAAGAMGEGLTAAGQNAEQVRQEDPNGTLTPQQSAILAASGALTGGISLASGKLANKLGIGDVQTMLAAGKLGTVGEEAAQTAATKGFTRKLAEGFANEGVLQELPQSYQEQVAQNLAQDKPWDEGAAKAGAQGMMAGALMGGGANAASHFAEGSAPAPAAPEATAATTSLQLGNTPDPYLSFSDGTVARRSEVDSYINALPEDQQPAARAKIMGLSPQPVVQDAPAAETGIPATEIPVAPVKPSEVMGLDPAAGPMSAAAVIAVDTGAHQPQAPRDSTAAVEPDPAVSQLATMPEATHKAAMTPYSLFGDSGHQEGDVLGESGKPFSTRESAMAMLNKHPGGEIAEFSNGFVIRRPSAADISHETAGTVQPQEAVHGSITPAAGLDQPAAAKPVDQLAGGWSPALGAVPAGGGKPGNAGVAAGATEPGAAVVAAGGGTAAIAAEMRATQGHWDKLHARADKITAPAVKQAQMAFENAEIDAAAFEAVIASAEKGANQPAATAAPAQQKAGSARDQAIANASSAAKDVLTKGGTEADANRAATDSLIGQMAANPGIRIAIDAPAAVKAAKQQATAPAATAQAVPETVAPAAPAPAVAATPVKWFGTKAKAGAYLIKNTLVKTHEVVDAGKGRFEVRERAGTTPQAASAPEATSATSTVKGKRVVNSKFPPTEVRAGQTVRKDGKDYVVTGPIKGGISAARQVSTQGGVTETDTIFLIGDDAIEARIEAQKEEPEAEAVTPQVAAAAIVVDKAEMRPYRKPDGSVGYEAVPIQEEMPAAEASIQAPKIGAQMLDERIKSDVAKKQAEAPVAPPAIPKAEAKPDPLTEKEKAAKAKMFGALGKLAALAGKNTRMNWTPEEEQQLLPIVIELFDGAMELGSVTFQKAVRYVRDFISSNLDQETADAIPFETLQGAYIHTARKFKDQGATTGKEVMSFDSLAELENSGEQADTETKDTTNDSTEPTDPPALNRPLDEGQRPAGSKSPARGARSSRAGSGRANDGSVRPSGELLDGGLGEGQEAGRRVGGDPDVQHGLPDGVAGDNKRVSAPDYIPASGGLTREGSWFETAKRNIDLIELAIQIEKEGRPATADEQAQLAKYVGFGASEIRNALFPVPHAYAKSQEPTRLIWPNMVREARWKPLAERMDALPREWQQTILQSSQYAHYTSEGIIRSVWSAIERLGFTGGKVFEPGMGIGSFAMLMPENVRSTSRYTGVEFDGPTALIARLLSPQQHMLHGDFIKRTFPKNFFDVNVGNPPFSQTKVLGDPNYEKHGFMLHDFFFAKGIDLVRPGGLQVFVTSKGTMDKQTDKARKYLSERADLLGAIRLPSTAFEGNAGTSVVTDVIFLRKKAPGDVYETGSTNRKTYIRDGSGNRIAEAISWNGLATVETKDGPTLVNEYFAAHPDMVLGQQRISGNVDDAGRRISSNGMGGEKYTVVSYDTTPAELDAKFAKAIENLPENAYSIMGQSADSLKAETAKVDFDPSIKREGVVYLGKDGAIMRVESGMGKPLDSMVKLSDKDKAWFKSYVGLRDLVQLARQAQHTDGNWEAALKTLNKAYDKFRKDHGPIQDYRVQVRKSTDEDGNVVETESRILKNNRLLREDYDRAILGSMETITESGEIVKSPFLLGRTIGKPVTREVRSIGDALAVSLDEVGSLNLDDVARRMKISPNEAIDALGSQIYQTPEGMWQMADEYLSGNVVEKLEEAMQAVQHDPSLKRNVEALKEAQPEKLGPSQISAKLGASWVPAAHVNEFAKLIEAGTVTFDSKTETWQVDGGNLRSQRKAGAEYGTAQRSPSELLEAALNSRTVKVMQTIDKKTTIDEAATVAATEAVKKIKDKFKGWIWTDSERATELVESYNHRYNNIAPRKFDGLHLTLPGVSLRFKLHPHQLRAIWRMVQTGNTYLAHAVGAGKTIEMIAGGMEQKRLGLIKKPMYVVPNHMLEQFSNEFMELYPLANIMVADDENFSADRRKAFIASATLNNPDAIVITHDAFQRIGVKEESVVPIRDEILADLEIELSETAKDQGARVRRSQLEQQIEAVKQRFDRIIGAGGKDSTIKFEDMGVDFVFADESHAFRKLDFHTAQQIKGIDPNGSKRAMDMYVKTRILDKQRPGRAFVFASGTPVTNTMGELYTIMRFFASEELNRSGISTFDAWARQFGEVAPALEPNAAGKYEMVERFAKFDNVPELMSRVRQFMDVLTSDSLGSLVKRPDLKGGKPNLNVVPSNPALDAYMKGALARRIEVSKAWKPSKDQPHNPDPIVSIITDGRFAAIDPRFFGAPLPEDSPSIITAMGAKVVDGYKAHRGNVYLDKNGTPEPIKGGTQIVFYNLGFGEGAQKSRGFNARAAFTKILTDGGIPRAEIAWFDDANTDAKKEAVFKDMRSGKLKVLIGSAKKMGTGVNVQKRLAVLHYQDPPWFPADVEQPHGRIIRQGNQNGEVAIEWYTTKGTYQSTMWQMVGRKQRFIDQAFTGDKTLRSMDDLGEASLFEQAAAVASGDPRAIQLAGLKQDVERFERLQAAHASEQVSVSTALRYAGYAIESAQGRIKKYSAAFKAIGESYFSFTTGKVGTTEFNKQGEFGQAIKTAFNKAALAAAANPAEVMPEQVLATLGNGITVTMEGGEEKTGKPTGWFDLSVHFGGESLGIYHAESLGADVDAVGLARRIINQINSVEVDLRKARTDLLTNETDTARLRKKLGAPFEYQQEMAEKYGDLKRLEAELRAEGEAKPAPSPQGITADGEIGSSSLNLQSPPPLDFKRQPPVMFSRQAATTRGTSVPQVQAMVDAITARWSKAPNVVVVADMADAVIPQAVRDYDQQQKSLGATGEPEGFVYKGKVYLLADQLATPTDAIRVLFHETLGHMGLRGTFGAGLKPILQQIATMRKAEVAAKAKQYGLNMSIEKDRLEAAEEVLAEMAEKYPNHGFVKRAIAVIRNWLRTNVPGFKSMLMTDADIIQAFILPARRHIEGGQAKAIQPIHDANLAALSRSQDQTDIDNPDIRYSRATVARYAKHASDKLNETFSHPGGMSLWDKTVGSMYHLAERNPPFKRVFDAAQAFIQDVSFYATEAADLAPKILPKLDTWKDMLKTPVSAADNKAISAPILQGTLSWARDESGKPVLLDELEATYGKLSDEAKAQMLLKKRIVTEDQLKRWKASPLDIYEGAVRNRFNTAFLTAGVVWKDAELQSMFNLTPAQISLYREFRAATDASLDNLAKADLLRFGGKEVAHLTDMVMDAATVGEAAELLRDYLHSQRDLMPERVDDLTDTAGGMIERGDKVSKLKSQGYAPLSRFGRYSVDVVVDGKREYFGLFESKAASNLMALKMKQEYGAASVAQGTMSQKEFELFQGITPESLELFGNMLGLDSTGNEAQDQAFQTYLKLTKTNRSAMKRMIHRKGTAGFSEDIGRVLAAFVYSNARQTSAALHMGELGDSVQAIPKGQGELKDAAVELSDYIKKPREEAQALRGLLFAQYLGGSVASAFVNFTQPLTVSFPYLSMYGGAKQSGAALAKAMHDQRAGVKLEDGLRQALHQAEEEGTVSPQSVHELMAQAQAQGRSTLNSGDGTAAGDALAGAKNNLAKLAIGWGKLFGLAEQINRRSTFIAAYRIAVAQNIANPAAFAIKAVNETQFISNKANKAKFARGAIGATLMTFKSYSTNYLELLHRMATQNGPEGKKAAALMLGMLFLMAGAGGLPFDDDLEDVADGFAQLLGYNFSSKKAKQEFLEDLFGKTMADFIDKGISGLPGSPIDVSGRMSMGNLIPGTGFLLQKRDHGSDFQELAGPAGDLVKRGFQAAGKLLSGDVLDAAKTIAPKAVFNFAKGTDMASTGAYNDDKGYKVLATTPFEAAMKAIGFQPHSVAEVQQSNNLHQRAKDFYSQHAQDINSRWAKGIYEGDPAQVAAARAMVQSWNEKNPEQHISANMSAILKRVNEMRKDKAQRIADTAPKVMRAQMKREVAEDRVQPSLLN